MKLRNLWHTALGLALVLGGGLLSWSLFKGGQPHPSQPSLSPSPTPTTTASPLQPNSDTQAIVQAHRSPAYQIAYYYSHAMGGKRAYGITLPPQYDREPHRRYPVIFLLHGGHGNPTHWFELGGAYPTLQRLYKTGQLPPSIVITPDGNDLRGSSRYFDPQYIDGRYGKVSTAIGEELVNIVRTRYRTLPPPRFWAIGGLSSGGWGALNIGLHHPQHFSVIFSHSGYFRDRSGPSNSPMTYITRLSPEVRQRFHIYLDAGTGDPNDRYLAQAEEFHQLLDRLGVDHVFYTFPGSHTWRYWREHLPDSLTYVGQQFYEALADHR